MAKPLFLERDSGVKYARLLPKERARRNGSGYAG
jgi:hypothetical protein